MNITPEPVPSESASSQTIVWWAVGGAVLCVLLMCGWFWMQHRTSTPVMEPVKNNTENVPEPAAAPVAPVPEVIVHQNTSTLTCPQAIGMVVPMVGKVEAAVLASLLQPCDGQEAVTAWMARYAALPLWQSPNVKAESAAAPTQLFGLISISKTADAHNDNYPTAMAFARAAQYDAAMSLLPPESILARALAPYAQAQAKLLALLNEVR